MPAVTSITISPPDGRAHINAIGRLDNAIPIKFVIGCEDINVAQKIEDAFHGRYFQASAKNPLDGSKPSVEGVLMMDAFLNVAEALYSEGYITEGQLDACRALSTKPISAREL